MTAGDRSAMAVPAKATLRGAITELARSPRELWIVCLAKFIESVGMMMLLDTVTLWLSSDFKYDDVQAGWWVGAFSLATTLFTFVVGFFADALGFRRVLLIAFAASAAARGTIAMAQTRPVAIAGLMFLSVGFAGGVPVMSTAIRRYTTPSTRAFGFSIYFLMFNVAGAVAGVFVDVSKGLWPVPRTVSLPLVGTLVMSQYRALYLAGFACALMSFAVSAALRRGVDLESAAGGVPPGTTAARVFFTVMTCACTVVAVQLTGTFLRIDVSMQALGIALGVAALGSIAVLAWLARAGVLRRYPEGEVVGPSSMAPRAQETTIANPVSLAIDVIRERAFWRFLLFVALLVLVKQVFLHWELTFPKYVTREMGPSFPLGAYLALNPLLGIVLVPAATALTRSWSTFTTIVTGTFFLVLSPFALCLGATYPTIIGMIVLLTIGESLFGPRLYEYTATAAPRGKEASYMALSSLPMFVAKVFTGPMSGYLLAAYCPAVGARHARIIWLVVGGMAAAGAVAVVLLRRVIEAKSAVGEGATAGTGCAGAPRLASTCAGG